MKDILCNWCYEPLDSGLFVLTQFDTESNLMQIGAICPKCGKKTVLQASGELEVFHESEDGVLF